MTDNGICTNILETEVFFNEPITDNDEITTNPKVDDTISST